MFHPFFLGADSPSPHEGETMTWSNTGEKALTGLLTTHKKTQQYEVYNNYYIHIQYIYLYQFQINHGRPIVSGSVNI